jgi:hypothetical protein
MIASEDDIQLRKFKMFAENIETTEKAVELCKKFLKHKGWDVDDIIKKSLVRDLEPPKIEKHYVGLKDLIQCQANIVLDDMNLMSLCLLSRLNLEQDKWLLTKSHMRRSSVMHFNLKRYTTLLLHNTNSTATFSFIRTIDNEL